ncbi:MAG: hypothetical protein AAF725_19585, partial [Acidobacteriota bacterium]
MTHYVSMPRALRAALGLLLLLTFPFLAGPARGQLLLLEDFTTDLQFTKVDGDGMPIQFFSDGMSSYFGTLDGLGGNFGGDLPPLGVGVYGGTTPLNSFLVVEDAGSTIDPLPVSLQWSNIDISGVREIDLFLDVASLNEFTFDPSDFLRVEFSVDGGAFVPVYEVRANSSGKMAEDTDFDGLGDGARLNGTLMERGEAALVDGSSLDIRLSLSVDEVAEDFAVDNLFVTEAPITNWTAAPPLAESFFDAANWSTNAVPTGLDDVAIRNGGSARSEGPAGGDPAIAQVAGLTVGDSLGSGTLELSGVEFTVGGEIYIGGQQPLAMPNQGTFSGTSGRLEVRDAATFSTLDTVNVGEIWSRGTASIESRGDLILEDIATVNLGGQLDIGGTRAIASSTATSAATVTARNLGGFTTSGDLDLCDTLILGPGTGVCEAQALFENIPLLTVGDDVEVGDAIAFAGQSMTSRSLLEIVDVDSFVILGDLELLTEDRTFPGSGTAQNDIETTMRLVRTDTAMSGSLGVGHLRLISDSVTRGIALLELIDSSLTVSGGTDSVIGLLAAAGVVGPVSLDA